MRLKVYRERVHFGPTDWLNPARTVWFGWSWAIVSDDANWQPGSEEGVIDSPSRRKWPLPYDWHLSFERALAEGMAALEHRLAERRTQQMIREINEAWGRTFEQAWGASRRQRPQPIPGITWTDVPDAQNRHHGRIQMHTDWRRPVGDKIPGRDA